MIKIWDKSYKSFMKVWLKVNSIYSLKFYESMIKFISTNLSYKYFKICICIFFCNKKFYESMIKSEEYLFFKFYESMIKKLR